MFQNAELEIIYEGEYFSVLLPYKDPKKIL